MRKITTIITITVAAVPLLAATPASRVKEPNAVFVYAISGEGRIEATLFDRTKRKVIDRLDALTDLPLEAGGSIDSNDAVQFSSATRKVYALVLNESAYDGSTIDTDAPYRTAIIETGFAYKQPTVVFSCDECYTTQWIVHPSLPKLYVSLPDPPENGDEFRSAKLVEVTLSPSVRTRVIGRIPSNSALRVTPDGSTLYVFGRATHSNLPYGALVRIDLSNRKRTQTVVNFPSYNVFDLPISPMTADVSPDTLEMAYHMATVDVRTGGVTNLLDGEGFDLGNYFIGWSRKSDRLLFQLMEPGGIDDRVEKPLVYDRSSKEQWILPIDDAHMLDWSPAETAILFGKRNDIGFYDLATREWVFVAEGQDGSWVTLPTKRVPKR